MSLRTAFRTQVSLWICALSGTAALPAIALAQGGQVRGRVHVAGDSTHVVPGAEVILEGTALATRVGADGSFNLQRVPAGKYTLRARKIGFLASAVALHVDSATITTIDVGLKLGAQAMSEVVIRGVRTYVPAKLADAYRRADHGFGHYFTRAQIDSLHSYDVKSLISGLAGVHVNNRGVEFSRCVQGAGWGTLPHIQVYVDGSRLTSYEFPGATVSVNQALANVAIGSVELVEVYSSVATMPPELAEDACAVIAIWTR